MSSNEKGALDVDKGSAGIGREKRALPAPRVAFDARNAIEDHRPAAC
jgi:hypothetical protein